MPEQRQSLVFLLQLPGEVTKLTNFRPVAKILVVLGYWVPVIVKFKQQRHWTDNDYS